jgi:hypothetical protein
MAKPSLDAAMLDRVADNKPPAFLIIPVVLICILSNQGGFSIAFSWTDEGV